MRIIVSYLGLRSAPWPWLSGSAALVFHIFVIDIIVMTIVTFFFFLLLTSHCPYRAAWGLSGSVGSNNLTK